MTVIVDSKLLYYEESHRHKPPIGLFDSLATMLKYLEDTTGIEVTKVVMVYDIGKSSYRQGLWPHYKAKRVYSHLPANFKTTYEMQVPLVASALGMKNFPVHGLEADDLAGILATKLKEDIVLVSGDADWCQIVLEHPERVKYFYVKKRELLDHEDIMRMTECTTVAQFLLKKVVLGDSADNIIGLPSIGPVKFKKWSDEAFSLSDEELKHAFLSFCKSTNKGTHKDYHEFGIQSCEDLYDFNMKLGRIMTDLSLLSVKQKVDVKACYVMPTPSFNPDEAQRIVSEHSEGFLGPFGDPYQLSPVSISYYEEVYNRRNIRNT